MMTVLGEIKPDKLGITMTHEHLLIDTYWITDRVDDLLNDEDIAVEELLLFKKAGGDSIVDLTNHGLKRNPEALKRISERTGVNVIMGCGWYRGPYYPEEITYRSTDELAREMIVDLTEGVGDTGIKAGIIGEIGVNLDYITPAEERVLRAAARAHIHTGKAVTLHAEYCSVGLDQLNILEEEGVNLERVIVGHADSFLNLNYHEEIYRRGAYIQFDGIGRDHIYPDSMRLKSLAELIKRGYIEKILLSTDRCRRSDLRLYGGKGYDHILVDFIPKLKKNGLTEREIEILMVDNPREILT